VAGACIAAEGKMKEKSFFCHNVLDVCAESFIKRAPDGLKRRKKTMAKQLIFLRIFATSRR
jgi:hypothetical protein